ncbi:hypothetical protein GW590_04375 [Rahnella sp. SAP-1]|uniref:Uncharacterized protein n=1 Tax=Rouxiella aceris TaxID=2703884 RepID=A0A848MCX0_9GAMM|nr:hypothetical protein [Rouxiella aceris]NMP26108.1 hypothetical protein [Rouxiella aceris]
MADSKPTSSAALSDNSFTVGTKSSERTAKRRGLGHTQKSLERTTTEGTTLINLDKAQDSKGGAPSPPLGGLGRRPVSAANALDLEVEVEVEVDLDLDLEVDFKSKFAIKTSPLPIAF